MDDDLQSWILSATSAPDAVLNNPVCDMIEAGYTAEEVNAYLAFIKPALENEPDPGYNGGEPDPYSAYNIDTDEASVNKVTQFLIDYPCVGVGDNLGLLLSEPEVVDWAISFLNGDCGSTGKTVVLKILELIMTNDDITISEVSDVINYSCSNTTDCSLENIISNSQCNSDLNSFISNYKLNLSLDEKLNIIVPMGSSPCTNNFENEAWAKLLYFEGVIDEQIKESISNNGIIDEDDRIIITPIDWPTATNIERANHLYKNLRLIYYMLVCKKGIWPEDNLSHSYSINEFFNNFSVNGDIWIANNNIEIQLLNKSYIDVTSLTIVTQVNTSGSDMINVLGVNAAPPVGNSSDLFSFYWPRGGTNNSNTSVVDIRADENTINIIQEDFFIPCN